MARERLHDEASENRGPGRMYEYWLGGDRHSEHDRQISEQMSAVHSEVEKVGQAHMAFVRRLVAFFRAQGIDQLVQIGYSIPVVGDMQAIVQESDGAMQVLFVDADPAEIPHSQARLEEYPNATTIHADLHQLDQVLSYPEVREVIDVTRPLALIFSAVLPYLTDDDEARRVVRSLRDALPGGSYLGMTHLTYENVPRELITQIEAIYAASFQPIHARERAELEPFFDGLELVPPGLVALPLWRPDADDNIFLDRPERSLGLGGVGYKP